MADEQTTEEEFKIPDTKSTSNPGGSLSVKLHSVRLTAKDVISHYSPDDWEELIERWVYKKYSSNSESESVEAGEYQIEKFAGKNDRGVDIAVFKKTDDGKVGFQGDWYCFQAKHYTNALTFADVFPEIFKMIRHVHAGHYVVPKEHYFVASNGFTTDTLNQLNDSEKLKAAFIEAIRPEGNKSPLAYAKKQGSKICEAVLETAKSIDFSIFKTMSRQSLVSEEETTTFYISREQSELPERDYDVKPEVALKADEYVYIKKLLDIYYEDNPPTPSPFCLGDVPSKKQGHFGRQREYFYSAEALRKFAEDSVPSGTYDALKQDILVDVTETAEDDHDDGMKRLRAVQDKASNTPLAQHGVINSRILPADRLGICHQLANEDKLTWVEKRHE